jgi:hypothetical protein
VRARARRDRWSWRAIEGEREPEGHRESARERESASVYARARERERERERARTRACVCERERRSARAIHIERERERARECVCLQERESARARSSVCVYSRARKKERERERLCVCARERECLCNQHCKHFLSRAIHEWMLPPKPSGLPLGFSLTPLPPPPPPMLPAGRGRRIIRAQQPGYYGRNSQKSFAIEAFLFILIICIFIIIGRGRRIIRTQQPKYCGTNTQSPCNSDLYTRTLTRESLRQGAAPLWKGTRMLAFQQRNLKASRCVCVCVCVCIAYACLACIVQQLILSGPTPRPLIYLPRPNPRPPLYQEADAASSRGIYEPERPIVRDI